MSEAAEAQPDPAATEVRTALHALYDELGAEIALAGPVCEVSGRCCRFAEYGHTLFLSAPEFALLQAEAPPPCRPLDAGLTCPWQDDAGRCTARDARPLGCRVYFCDPGFQEPAQALSERYIARLKELADRLRLPWDYAPLHRHLERAEQASGPSPTGPQLARSRVLAVTSGLTLVHASNTVEPTQARSGPDGTSGEPPS